MCSGLAVKERKWGKTGYNKSPTPVLRETTLPEILKDNLDSEQQKGGASDSIIGEEEVDGKDQPSAEVKYISRILTMVVWNSEPPCFFRVLTLLFREFYRSKGGPHCLLEGSNTETGQRVSHPAS